MDVDKKDKQEQEKFVATNKPKKGRSQKKKVILQLVFVVGLIASILMLDVLIAFARFEYDKSQSSVSKSMNDPYTLTIVYRPNCRRCRQVLPDLFMRHALSKGREYVIDASKLTPAEKQELGERSTPTFAYKGISVQTIDTDEIDAIWCKSH